MTPNQRRIYSELHIRATKRLGSPFITRIYNALHQQVIAFTTILQSSTIDHAKHELDRYLINTNLTTPITDLYKTFGVYQFNKTTRQINGSIKKTEKKAGSGDNPELLAEIIRYLRENILTKAVVPITQSLRKAILEKLIIGEREGWGVDRIARELESPDFLLWRARMIVRTESLMAMQFGQKAATKQSKWETESEWIAANDHRTRHAHRDVDGQTVDEGKKFKVPKYKKNVIIGYDYMAGPGDPTASAGNVINCRCSMATVAKRDVNGRLIPKKVGNSRISVILPNEVFKPSQLITV